MDRKCVKCGEEAVVSARVQDGFCRPCFVAYITHKFRAAIGKSKLIRDGERVLLAFSAGQSSTCLLDLITEGVSDRVQRKLRFKPSIVFIDEGLAIGMNQNERLELCCQAVYRMRQSGFPCYLTSLEMAMNLQSAHHDVKCANVEGAASTARVNESCRLCMNVTEPAAVILSTDKHAQSTFLALLKSTKTLTAKEDLICTLRKCLLIRIAEETDHRTVMLGTMSTRLAVQVLTDLAQGRGAQVSHNAGFANLSHPIRFVRPLKDLSSKETAMYNQLLSLQPLFIPTVSTKTAEMSSIQRLTEGFVMGLQAGYSSTVSNITRTGEKFAQQEISEWGMDRCSLCQSPLDTDVGPASALAASQFSKSLSRKLQSHDDLPDDSQCSKSNLQCALCYGCRLLTQSLDDMQTLPEYVLQDPRLQLTNRDEMKAAISDFLLPDDDSNT